jgi:hypothetical protein
MESKKLVVRCPQCQKSLKVTINHTGQKYRCPSCGSHFAVEDTCVKCQKIVPRSDGKTVKYWYGTLRHEYPIFAGDYIYTWKEYDILGHGNVFVCTDCAVKKALGDIVGFLLIVLCVLPIILIVIYIWFGRTVEDRIDWVPGQSVDEYQWMVDRWLLVCWSAVVAVVVVIAASVWRKSGILCGLAIPAIILGFTFLVGNREQSPWLGSLWVVGPTAVISVILCLVFVCGICNSLLFWPVATLVVQALTEKCLERTYFEVATSVHGMGTKYRYLTEQEGAKMF